jgi:hypothetical protein
MLAVVGETETAVTVGGGVGVGDPQLVTDIKAIGRARAMSLAQLRNEFMLALRKYEYSLLIDGLNPLKKIYGN